VCLTNLDEMKKCVDAASTNDELQACKTKMMDKMQGTQKMMQKAKNIPPVKGKCGSGKCGSK
jgi:hypothetical protein